MVTFAKPVRDDRGIEITFPFPDTDHLYQSKVSFPAHFGSLADLQPSSFIAHFIGHEGRGSVLSYLKGKGWVNSLRAGPFHPAAGFDAFKITMDLTPDGLGKLTLPCRRQLS
jgi:insulysin